jgi:PAS domain S-box-containing protein
MAGATNGGQERAYRALRESEELHRVTLSNISDAVFLTDEDGRFTFICPNVDVIFGYVPDEVQAMERIGRLLGEKLYEPEALAASGEIRNVEREVTAKSGERRTLLIHLKKVSIQGSSVLYACRDVTERRHAEDELRAARQELAHASRLALVGELTASIAHEVNQPLTSILANAEAGVSRLGGPPGPDELREVLTEIRDQGRRAADVIERVRALSRKRPLDRQALDLNELVGDIVRLVQGEARRRGVSVHTELVPMLPAVAADRVGLQQVVLNLMLNGMDAMDAVEAAERRLTVRTGRLDGAVEVAVSDNGHGIPADCLPRLFDAFYSTKAQGLGLGLAIARSIVEAHGGRIWAEERTGRGATFHWTVPARGTS